MEIKGQLAPRPPHRRTRESDAPLFAALTPTMTLAFITRRREEPFQAFNRAQIARNTL